MACLVGATRAALLLITEDCAQAASQTPLRTTAENRTNLRTPAVDPIRVWKRHISQPRRNVSARRIEDILSPIGVSLQPRQSPTANAGRSVARSHRTRHTPHDFRYGVAIGSQPATDLPGLVALFVIAPAVHCVAMPSALALQKKARPREEKGCGMRRSSR